MKNNTTIAWAPANISLIFKVHQDSDLKKMGSYGLGFTINEGVTVTVSKANKMEILFNDKPINFPTVKAVINEVLKQVDDPVRVQDNKEGDQNGNINIKVSIVSNLPLGCGFGLSGASALATSYALNELLDLKKDKLELAKIAHFAEVKNKTGLGDVVNQYFGGFLLKIRPSSEFIVEKIPLKSVPVYTKVFDSLKTSSVLSDKNKMNIIEKEGSKSLYEVQKLIKQGNVQISQLFDIAKKFVEKSDLIFSKEVIKTLKEIENNGGHATMILLGNSVVADIPFPGSTKYIISSVGAHLRKG